MIGKSGWCGMLWSLKEVASLRNPIGLSFTPEQPRRLMGSLHGYIVSPLLAKGLIYVAFSFYFCLVRRWATQYPHRILDLVGLE